MDTDLAADFAEAPDTDFGDGEGGEDGGREGCKEHPVVVVELGTAVAGGVVEEGEGLGGVFEDGFHGDGLWMKTKIFQVFSVISLNGGAKKREIGAGMWEKGRDTETEVCK